MSDAAFWRDVAKRQEERLAEDESLFDYAAKRERNLASQLTAAEARLAEALRVLDTIDDEGDDHYYGIADRARMILRGTVTDGDCSGPTVNRTADSASAQENDVHG